MFIIIFNNIITLFIINYDSRSFATRTEHLIQSLLWYTYYHWSTKLGSPESNDVISSVILVIKYCFITHNIKG